MAATGTILIEKLDIYAYHGVFSEEERLGQRFVLDIAMKADLSAAALSDDLKDTVNYGDVVAVVAATFTSRPYKLLEAAARAVALAIFETFPGVSHIAVTLRKPAPPIPATLASVGVHLEFSRDG